MTGNFKFANKVSAERKKERERHTELNPFRKILLITFKRKRKQKFEINQRHFKMNTCLMIDFWRPSGIDNCHVIL